MNRRDSQSDLNV